MASPDMAPSPAAPPDTSPLPLPPPPPGGGGVRPLRPARPGQVTIGWRAAFGIGWGGVILGLGAVVRSSRTTGLSTWWLGPESDPNLLVLMALPFAVGVLMIVLAFRNVRHLPYYGVVGAIALAAIATGDVGRFDALAQVELATAGIGLLVSVAAFAGLLRPLADDDPDAALEVELAAGVAAHPAQVVPPLDPPHAPLDTTPAPPLVLSPPSATDVVEPLSPLVAPGADNA